ncbi:sorting nexin 1 [Quillaja saponaria]|uniref:Sorting nexin 1 n=1 Tax=Quillaja saponaria TaxID=32244 RepID=A0AAD7VDK1_QUISA|nr:sorting nexin 1 [Quillaja saponaria]
MRCQALDILVNRIASHSELQQSEDLRTFLEADEEDVQSKVNDVVLRKEKPIEESNPEYEKLKHYIFKLENHLVEAQKHAYRMVKRHRESLSVKLQKEAHQLLMNFEELLKDYVHAVQSIKATIVERANSFRQQCELIETIKLKEINLDKLMLIQSDKVGEAEIEYKEASWLRPYFGQFLRKFITLLWLD